MSKRVVIVGITIIIGIAAIAMSLFVIGPAMAKEPSVAQSEAQSEVSKALSEDSKTRSEVTYADVNWTFTEPSDAVGDSQLVRTNNGVNARLTTSGLPAGQAVTAWFIFWNNPELCSPDPENPEGPPDCGLDDLGATPARGDFHLVTGHVIGRSGNATFAGNLKVGDLSTSGLNEVICPETKDCGIALEDPTGALVVLAVHSHGPALTGQALKEQISSYSGGCETYLGPDGFAAVPDDLPDDFGECSTIQMSPHPPSG